MRRKHRRSLLAVKFLPGIGSLFRLQRTHQRTAPIHAQKRFFNRIFPLSLVFTLLPFTHPHPFGPGTSLTVIGLRPDKGHHQHDSHNGYQPSQQNKLSGIHSNRSFIASSGLYILDNTIIVQNERGQYKSTFFRVDCIIIPGSQNPYLFKRESRLFVASDAKIYDILSMQARRSLKLSYTITTLQR